MASNDQCAQPAPTKLVFEVPRFCNGHLTQAGAEHLAQQMWTNGAAVGQVRWRRTRTPRFWVGLCFTDGRPPETMGESNVDWESAFALAQGNIR